MFGLTEPMSGVVSGWSGSMGCTGTSVLTLCVSPLSNTKSTVSVGVPKSAVRSRRKLVAKVLSVRVKGRVVSAVSPTILLVVKSTARATPDSVAVADTTRL